MTIYIVSHYWQNPKHNTTHKFTNYREAQEEYMQMSSDETPAGCTYLEIEDDKFSWKRRSWNERRGIAHGKFSKK